jgi:hypothetical protein
MDRRDVVWINEEIRRIEPSGKIVDVRKDRPAEWQENHGRWVHRGNGLLPIVSLLRIIAYNLLEMLHAVHLRSEAARKAAWQQLRDWVRNALVWPVEGMPDLPEACATTP